MFTHQKWNGATRLNRTIWIIYPFGSEFKQSRYVYSLMSLGHTSTKPHCEIQGEVFEFREEHKWLVI